jgi:hypothetical protein
VTIGKIKVSPPCPLSSGRPFLTLFKICRGQILQKATSAALCRSRRPQHRLGSPPRPGTFSSAVLLHSFTLSHDGPTDYKFLVVNLEVLKKCPQALIFFINFFFRTMRSVRRLRHRSTQELVLDRAPRMVSLSSKRLILCPFRSSTASLRLLLRGTRALPPLLVLPPSLHSLRSPSRSCFIGSPSRTLSLNL